MTDRTVALADPDRRDARVMQRPREFLLDQRVAGDFVVAKDDRAGRDAEAQGVVDVERSEGAVTGIEGV